MDKEQEVRKLINVLSRTGRMAWRAQWAGAGDEGARFGVEQYNRILRRLIELEPTVGTVFAPLEAGSSLQVVAMACRQLVAYFEEEPQEGHGPRHEDWNWPRDKHAATFFLGPLGAFCYRSPADVEELGNRIRDWVQSWKGGPRPRPEPGPKESNE